MGAWATMDKDEVAAQQTRVQAAFETAIRALGLTPRSLMVTYSPVAEGERTIKIQVECMGDARQEDRDGS
jgi:hypothetical protein